MSAAAATPQSQRAPQKVLRIGVVQDGKVARERLMRINEPVLVGDGPRATFPIPNTQIGAQHELFVPKGDHYVLAFPEWVEGKISWRDGIRGLDELRTRGDATRKGDLWHLPLTDTVKGKVTIGSTTILFQFVQAPPEPVRPISPADFRRPMLDDEDPLFLGLLGVFGAIATAFQIFVLLSPPIENENLDFDDAVDLIIDAPIEQIKIPTPDQPGKEEKVEKKEEKADTTKSDASNTPAKPAAGPTAESVAKKSLLIAVLGTDGAAAGAALDAEGGSGKLDEALQGVSGVQQASAGNTGVKTGGAGGRGDAQVGVGVATGGSSGTGSGVATVVKKPKVDYGEVDADVSEGDKGGIGGVMRKSSGRIASCVEQGLKQNPDLSGRVSVGFVVTAGKVSDVHLVKNTTGSDSVGTCIVSTIRSIRFDASLSAEVAEYPFVVSGQ